MAQKNQTAETDQTFAGIVQSLQKAGEEIIKPAAVLADRDARFPQEAYKVIRELKLLSCYVPKVFGGMGLSITQVCKLCEILSGYCASSGLIFSMHQIQVACILHHAMESTFFVEYLKSLADKQYLLASATTELGVGGDLRSSKCAVKVDGDSFTLEKNTPVISYGKVADAILVTCRRAKSASASDQVQILVRKEDYTLEQTFPWDTLGFRATCSEGFILRASGKAEQILPAPFSDILSRSMHPFSHLTWASVWLGLARDAMRHARNSVRNAARKNPDAPAISSLRLTEADELLYNMKAGIYSSILEYQDKLTSANKADFSDFGSAIRINNVKLQSSELVVDIVSRAMVIVGIAGYKNDSPVSLGRHLRDAYGALLMVNNDRIRNHNSTMQIMFSDQ